MIRKAKIMTIYYSTYAIMIFFAIISKSITQNNKARNRFICIINFIMLFGILALRHWSVGNDLGFRLKYNVGYIPSFQAINTHSWSEVLKMESFLNYEKGYVIFNKLVGSVYNNKQFFLAVCAFIDFISIAILIYEKSKLPLLSWMIFLGLPVFLIFFSGLRQGIAISIIVLSVKFIDEKKIIKFILTVLLASTFHKSAIVFFIAYPLYHVKISGWKSILSILIIPIVFVLRQPLFSIFSKIFKDDAHTRDNGSWLLFVLFCVIYIALTILNHYNRTKNNKFLNLFYFACLCQAFSGIYTTAMRVGYYFMIFLIIALPNAVYELKNNTARTSENEFILGYITVFAAFVVYGIYALSTSTWGCTNPYYFFWQSVIG